MKQVPIQISVVGSGPFPIDMLRYDGCFPLSEADSTLISRSIESPIGVHRKIKVALLRPHGYKHWTPTYKRWKSYGWDVTETIERKEL